MVHKKQLMKKLTIRRLHGTVRKSLAQCGIGSGSRIVVAVSGGPDSLTLLDSLNHLRGETGFDIHGAHLNHKLRGEASDDDARFVRDSFENLGITYTISGADVTTYQKERRLSLEQAARELRYDFLASVAAEQNADAIATGHTADDQAETVLMHIIRGSGLTGLRGMEAVSRRTINGKDVTVIRPMLDVSRDEVLEYCRARKLDPRRDESNLSPEITRNRVRLELMPLLEQYNPSIRDALVRLSRSAAQDTAFIEANVDTEWNKTVQIQRGVAVIDRSRFQGLPSAIASHLLRRVVLQIKGDLEDVEQNHIADMARLMTGKVGASLNLPGALLFSVGYDEAKLSRMDYMQSPAQPVDGEHRLQIPGQTLIPGWSVSALILESHEKGTDGISNDTDACTATFDYNALGGDLHIRSRRPGDRIQPLGITHTRKVQDVLVDAKIPKQMRDGIPLVVSSKGIAWVVGCRIAHWARVKDTTTRKLVLRFERL
jgi:tRNA(Ile)-lysidine synthase